MRIVDRMLLEAAWPAVAIALACEALMWSLGSRVAAFIGGAYAVAIGLAVAYARLSRDGELAALQMLGIAPRRISAAVDVLCVLAALLGASIACVFGKPAIRTEYAGYVLAALQLPLAGSLALPVVVYAGREEPWALMCLALLGYTLVVLCVVAFARAQGWAPGLEWFFVDAALFAADVMLYRRLTKGRSRR
ncbi:MAG TPA: hypothetical protein VK669_01450 [Candidatus Limnocylindrales bacterium]|nr:hypothetical protein [Candidatus Limnocylindrales bacterium]